MLNNYPFWIQDFNRASKFEQDYPLTKIIFEYPNATWLTGKPKWAKSVDYSIRRTLKRAWPYLPVFVLYSIPNRDLGQYSSGGSDGFDAYLEFCRNVAKGIGDNCPILIYEPDGLAHVHNMEAEEAADRIELMREAIHVLRTSKAQIYIDAGHSNWLCPTVASDLLGMVEVEQVNGFCINTSNFRGTEEAIEWGDNVCSMLPSNIGYVIDTSRNGNGPLDSEWCNPPNRSLGVPATSSTSSRQCHAYLWVKVPGESDGTCNGGPRAGHFWPEYAEELVRNSGLGDNGNYKS